MSEADGRPGEPVRRGEGAEGFPHGSKYPLFVGGGMFFTALGLEWLPVLLVGVPVLAYGTWGWTREYAVEEYERGVVPEQKRQLLGIETGLLAMYVLVISELLIFAALFVAWFYLKAESGPFPPPGYPAPDLLLGVVLVGLMGVGSLAVAWARAGVQRGERQRLLPGFGVALLSGVAFLGVLALDWTGLMAGGVSWTTGPYGATFYALTGVHAGHLLAGLAMVGLVLWRARARGHFSAERNLMVRTTEVYWHFLTFVSVLVLAFVYFPSS